MHKSRSKLRYINFQEVGMLIALVLFSVFVAYRNSSFLTLHNLNDIMRNSSILLIMGLGMMMVIITRGIDLSIGATIGLSGMIVSRLMIFYPAIHPVIAMLLGMAAGAIAGLINGILISRGNVLPIIATMGMMNVYRGLCYIVSGGTWVSAYEMTESFKNIALGSFLGINYLIVRAC